MHGLIVFWLMQANNIFWPLPAAGFLLYLLRRMPRQSITARLIFTAVQNRR
jgi:hypothetical protein